MRKHRFPRSRRLFDKDFAAVIHAGKVFRGHGLAILLKKTDMTSRFGVVVPKRFVALAVARNRSKRVLREWFRHNGLRLLGRDCVIRITAPLRSRNDEIAMIAEVERLLSAMLPSIHP